VEREPLEVDAQSAAQAQRKTTSSIKSAAVWILILAGFFILESKTGRAHSRGLIVLAIAAMAILVLGLLPILLQWTVGTIGLVQISSPDFEQRIRSRYQAETSALAELGFYHLFFAGDDISIFRLLLIFPVMIVFSMAQRSAHDRTGWDKIAYRKSGIPIERQNGICPSEHLGHHISHGLSRWDFTRIEEFW
jgi:hypothetical protein